MNYLNMVFPPLTIEQLGLRLTAHQLQQFEHYLESLLQWNRIYNLTAITDPDAIYTKHFLDSLAIWPYLRGQRLLDVGTGAGFPGLVLAITFPALQVTLLDSNQKKVHFLHYMVQSLQLNCQIVSQRVETYSDPHGFAMITSRAFATLATFTQQTQSLLSASGQWLALKGTVPQAELAQLGLPYEVHLLTVPNLSAERHLIVIKQR